MGTPQEGKHMSTNIFDKIQHIVIIEPTLWSTGLLMRRMDSFLEGVNIFA